MENKIDFEKALTRLEEIVDTLEKGNCTLEESFALFEEGTKLSKSCYQIIEDAKLKITQLEEKE